MSAEDDSFRSVVGQHQNAVDVLTRVLTAIVGWIETMLAGAMAGAIAKSVIAPGDRVKIIFQADANRRFSLAAALKVATKIVEGSGVAGLWTGHTATLLRIMPYAATSYTSFDYYKQVLNRAFDADDKSGDDRRAIMSRFFAGAAAGATATALVYPLDLLRARFAAHWDTTKRYPSYVAAVKAVVEHEGYRALYFGLTPTLIGIVPYSGITYCVYETLAASVSKFMGLDSAKQLPPVSGFLCGSLAGLIGQSATYPLDIVRRRMQVHPERYRTTTSTFRMVVKEEGVRRGLFKGLSMNWIKGPISVGISFASRDYFKRRIRDYHQRHAIPSSTADDFVRLPGHTAATDLTTVERVACGGLAGGMAKLWTIPFDRVRIMYAIGRQTIDEHGSSSKHVASVMRELFLDSPHMWQGSAAMMARTVPYASICYTSFHALQPFAQRVTYASRESQTMSSNFVAGALGGSIATVAMYPMDLLHARAAAAETASTSYVQELKKLGRHGPRALFKGVVPAVVGIAPTAGLSFALYYEGVRVFDATSFASQVMIGAAAGSLSTVATYPLNVVRRTMQVEAVDAGIVQHLNRIYRHNGLFTGLYRRMPLGWVLSPATIGMSFAMNDALTRSMLQVRSVSRSVHFELGGGEDELHNSSWL